MKRLIASSVGIAAMFMASTASADYPERPVTLIVAYSSGGGSDVFARTIEPFIEKHLGVDVVVENITGAGGAVGFTAIAEAEPDGYTIGVINPPTLQAKMHELETRYDLDSFTYLGNVVDDPGAYNVATGSPFDSWGDVVEFARENPRVVTVGVSSLGGDDHINTVVFMQQNDIEFTIVPFQGAAQNRNATMGGHVAVGAFNMGEAISFSDNLKTLVSMGEQRWDAAPDVPTMKEEGFELVGGSQRGLGAPAGLPDDIRATLETAIAAAVDDPDFVASAAERGVPLGYMDGATYEALVRSQDADIARIWEETPWAQK